MSAIYKIRNVVNGKFYVGSTIDPRVRFQCHRRQLRKGTHHCQPLQHAWNKYGEDCFKFEVVEPVQSRDDLHAVENRWLEEHHGQPHCYNVSKCADAPTRGMKFSDETKAKISRALKGNQCAKGHKRPPEECEAIRLRSLGKKNFLGRTHTDEAKAKVSAAQKGKRHRLGHTNSPEHRRRISEANKGRKVSPERVEQFRKLITGNSFAKGRVVSHEQRAIFFKRVIETTSGLEFESVIAAATHFGIQRSSVSRLLGLDRPLKRGPHAGLHFRYLPPPA